MAGRIDARLKELGLIVPDAAAPAANYVPYKVSGNLVFVSGQIPVIGGDIKYVGVVGRDISTDAAYEGALLCGLNLIAQVRAACGGDLDKVRQVVRIEGFVACVPDFNKHPMVINGASDLMMKVFGDAGRHARFAVGAPSLPLNVSVEIAGIFEIDG